jgi:hypothetical protein
MTMTLIETKTLGTAAASIEFTSIPQDGTDLLFLFSLRSTADVDFVVLAMNASTANFTQRYLAGTGSNAFGLTQTNALTAITNPSTTTANTFSNASFYIPNYAGSTNKSFSLDVIFENNATLGRQQIHAGLWSDTAAITSVSFTVGSSTFVTGSTISLYKITKGSDGIVTTS